MSKVNFFIAGQEVTGLTAELQFMEWVLSLGQENDKELAEACDGDRCALAAMRIFQRGAFGNDAQARALLVKSGLHMVYRTAFIKANEVKEGDTIFFDTINSAVTIDRVSESKCDSWIGLHGNNDTYSTFLKPTDRIQVLR